MISWIVANNDAAVLECNLLATLRLVGADELIVLSDPESITMAYAEGQAKASQPIRCYVHSDVQVLDLARLRAELREWTGYPGIGIVGVIGSRDECMPWWKGATLGSVEDARTGLFHSGRGGQCAILDGLLLATRAPVVWDTDWPGWHGYDHDACAQMLRLNQVNWCLTNGHELVRHNTSGSFDQLVGWDDAVIRYKAKWGESDRVGR